MFTTIKTVTSSKVSAGFMHTAIMGCELCPAKKTLISQWNEFERGDLSYEDLISGCMPNQEVYQIDQPVVQESIGKNHDQLVEKSTMNQIHPIVRTIQVDQFTLYEGETLKGIPNGNGRQTLANGNKYEGDFVNGKKQGKGIYTFADGSRYQGDFLHNQMAGYGKYFYSNGDVYQGNFLENQKNGKGSYYYHHNGNTFTGHYSNGLRNGRGILQTSNQTISGNWLNNILTLHADQLIFS